MDPGPKRTVIVGLLVVLMIGTVGLTHIVVGAERTVLDPGFVTTSLSETGTYTAVGSFVES